METFSLFVAQQGSDIMPWMTEELDSRQKTSAWWFDMDRRDR